MSRMMSAKVVQDKISHFNTLNRGKGKVGCKHLES
jgi:hypothetical protein